MITCMIVDDEQHAIDLLAHYIDKTPFLHLTGTLTNPVKALELTSEQTIDLIFLDVQMPEMSGIEFMKALNGRSKVILTTAYSDYAIEGYDNEVVDYLLKPISFARFIKGARRALAQIQQHTPPEQDDYMLVKTGHKGKLLKININDIVYIEGLKNYVGIHTREGKQILALLNIRDLSERLPAERFVRTHKSFILATPYITMIEGNTVQLAYTSNRLPVGETYRKAFIAKIKDKIMSNRK